MTIYHVAFMIFLLIVRECVSGIIRILFYEKQEDHEEKQDT